MRRITVIAVILFLLITCCSCSDGLYINDGNVIGGTQLESIPDNNILETAATTLYFGMANENYLLTEERMLQYNASESLVHAVLNALISGPEQIACKALINNNTKLLSVTTNNKYVYLSFSEDLLEVPAVVDGWQSNPIIAENVYKQRRLALYSIVNTLTLTGEYAYVQIYIDTDNDGVAEKITRGEAGFIGDGNENEQLDMLVRDHNYIYTPVTAVKLVMELISKNQPKRLYDIIGRADDGSKMSYDDFANVFSQANGIVGDYFVSDNISVSSYGNTFTVIVDYSVKIKGSNNAIIYNDIPVKVIRKQNLYIVDMGFVENILKG